MQMNFVSPDIVLSALVIVGMLQMAWFSVMLLRRGASPVVIQQAIPAFLTIWVLMWPVYTDARWLGVGLFTLLMLAVLATLVKTPFWQHLRVAWGREGVELEHSKFEHSEIEYPRMALLPQLHLLLALFVAGGWFQAIPEFGLGLALCLGVAFPAAYWIDEISQRYGFLILGFPAHPQQTLAGHLLLIIISTVLLCWSLNVYHGTEWPLLLIATLIASAAASCCRALVPGQWNAPAAMLSMGLVMWVL
ncbi:MAG: hypothetical protein Q9M16_06065 [Mariprofundus sp.]|nr:hypothetical protein [Mariprofundus sp.]